MDVSIWQVTESVELNHNWLMDRGPCNNRCDSGRCPPGVLRCSGTNSTTDGTTGAEAGRAKRDPHPQWGPCFRVEASVMVIDVGGCMCDRGVDLKLYFIYF